MKQNYNIDFESIKELISKYEQIKKSGKIKKYNSKFYKEYNYKYYRGGLKGHGPN
jgi:hypothetical protein